MGLLITAVAVIDVAHARPSAEAHGLVPVAAGRSPAAASVEGEDGDEDRIGDDRLRGPAEFEPEEAPFRPSPGGAFRRSIVLPGWGQLYNRRPIKALLFAAGRVYLAHRAIDEHLLARDHEAYARVLEDGPERDRVWRQRNFALGRRDDFIWWSVYALLFTMTEAYVDAALMDFDDEFEPVREVDDEGNTVRLGYRIAF